MTPPMPALLFENGPIYPMNGPPLPRGAALLTRGGVIDYVGPAEALPRSRRADARVVDLDGRPLLPGLCDAHHHLVLSALQALELNCREATAAPALRRLLSGRAREVDPGAWIVGSGLPIPQLGLDAEPGGDGEPTAVLIEAATPDHPVFLIGRDMHSAWLNQAALARLERLGAAPAGCLVQRRAKGRPGGLVYEEINALRDLLVPRPDPAQKRALLAPHLRGLLARGITCVHCPEPLDDLGLVRDHLASAAPDERLRVLWHLVLDNPEALRRQRSLMSEAQLPGWLGPGGVKLFVDGTFGSRTAALSEPYLGTSDRGLLILEGAALDAWLEAIHEVGTHGVFHCIGDRAVEEVLTGLGRHAWPAGTIHRLEHVQLLSDRILARFDLAHVALSIQPSHMWGDQVFASQHLEPALDRRAYALRTMLDQGALVVFGSDAPVEDPDPWRGIQAAVTRLAGGPHGAWNPDERIDLLEALAAHTTAPARLHGRWLGCGALDAGAAADLVVLDEDPLARFARAPDSLVDGIDVLLTVVDGEVVYGEP